MEFTKERLLKIQSWSETYGPGRNVVLPAEEAEGLAHIALDAQAAGPVYQWRERYVDSYLWDDCTKEQYEGFAKHPDFETRILYTAPPAPVSVPDEVNVLLNHLEDVLPDEAFNKIDVKTWNNVSMLSRPDVYRAAMLQGSDERHVVRSEHAEWSQSTFGDVGPVGPLKHLSKEALEAAAEPGDLSEWADMQFLLWDAQRRAGITDEQITLAMIEKLAVNKSRTWPEQKDGEPRLHIKAGPQQELNS